VCYRKTLCQTKTVKIKISIVLKIKIEETSRPDYKSLAPKASGLQIRKSERVNRNVDFRLGVGRRKNANIRTVNSRDAVPTESGAFEPFPVVTSVDLKIVEGT